MRKTKRQIEGQIKGQTKDRKKSPVSLLQPERMRPVGILGGGQLARMLALRAHELGVPVAVLSERDDDPAAQVCASTRGELNDPEALQNFVSACSVVTFESEFLDAALLESIARQTKTPVFPRPLTLFHLQDRLLQKNRLIEASLPTARFFSVSSLYEAKRALFELGGSAVFKKRRFGYDGNGTFVVRNESDLKRITQQIESDKFGFIAEELIDFERELAVIVARSRCGDSVRLPFVETHQENSRCLWVKGPLPSSSRLVSLGKKIDRFIADLDYVGVLAFELFEVAGKLLVNELAPRIHNSGHYSQDALSVDQFSLHLKAVLGLKLGDVPKPLQPGFAMMNLIGSGSKAPKWNLPTDVRLHWYGKSENRKGRKMGHLNALGKSPAEALALAKKRRLDFSI